MMKHKVTAKAIIVIWMLTITALLLFILHLQFTEIQANREALNSLGLEIHKLNTKSR